jgi:hypothetical protein
LSSAECDEPLESCTITGFCEEISCGGFLGTPCPAGLACVDKPGDLCDPAEGGIDCPGICLDKMSWTVIDDCQDGSEVRFRLFEPATQTVSPRLGVFRVPLAADRETVTIDCTPGEEVCIGAEADVGQPWGIGINGDRPCPQGETCCVDCVTERTEVTARLICQDASGASQALEQNEKPTTANLTLGR